MEFEFGSKFSTVFKIFQQLNCIHLTGVVSIGTGTSSSGMVKLVLCCSILSYQMTF